jgi:hypothetical protein
MALDSRSGRISIRSLHLIFIAVFLPCLFVSACGHSPPAPMGSETPLDRINIRVDPRVELFSTIHRLAGTGQYDERELPAYIRDVEDYFGAFKDHRAIRMASELRRSHNLDGNSPMSLAVFLTHPPDLRGRVPLVPPPESLDRRWTGDVILGFLDAARDFAHDAAFMEFYNAHSDLYDQAVQNLRGTLRNSGIRPWFQAFFGYQPEEYVIILGLQNGSCNYAAKMIRGDGTREYYSILGAGRPDRLGAPRYTRRWVVPIIVHEFCHSYVNPLVHRNLQSLRESGEKIFPHLETKMRQWGYYYWFVMIQEYMVRACVLRYLESNKGSDAYEDMVTYDERAGFPGIRGLAECLIDYERKRDEYPDLERFIPRIAQYFADLAASWQ